MGERIVGTNVASLSVGAATITLTQNIIGAGLLSTPYALKSAGIVGGLVLLAVIYVLSVFTMVLLVNAAVRTGVFTYKEISDKLLGERCSVAVEVWVLCYTLGILISYPIFIADFLKEVVLHFSYPTIVPHCHTLCMVIAVAFVCFPLSCAGSLGMLKYTSMAGLCSIALVTVTVIVRYVDGTYESPETNNFEVVSFNTLGNCFPILV